MYPDATAETLEEKLPKKYAGKVVVVTGAAGFIGSSLVHRLGKLGANVRSVDNRPRDTGRWPETNTFRMDVTAHAAWLPFKDADFVFHLACANQEVSENDNIENIRTNVLGTACVLEHTLNHSKPDAKFLFTSSVSVYGNSPDEALTEVNETEPTTKYGMAKLAAEAVVRHNTHDSATILRLSNVYGPGMLYASPHCGVVGKWAWAAVQGLPLPVVSSMQMSRDYTYITDVVSAILMAAGHPGVYNVGTDYSMTLQELHKRFEEVWGTKLPYYCIDNRQHDTVRSRRVCYERLFEETGWFPATIPYYGIDATLIDAAYQRGMSQVVRAAE